MMEFGRAERLREGLLWVGNIPLLVTTNMPATMPAWKEGWPYSVRYTGAGKNTVECRVILERSAPATRGEEVLGHTLHLRWDVVDSNCNAPEAGGFIGLSVQNRGAGGRTTHLGRRVLREVTMQLLFDTEMRQLLLGEGR